MSEDNLKEVINELSEKIAIITLRVQTIEENLEALKSGNVGSGIYLEGASPIIQKYVNSKMNKKANESED